MSVSHDAPSAPGQPASGATLPAAPRSKAANNTTRPRRWLLRPLSFAVLVVLAGSTVAAGLTVRHVVADEERRLLEERANEVVSVLGTTFASTGPAMAQLSTLAGSTGFAAAASAFLAAGTKAVFVVAQRGGSFVVVSAAGDAPSAGSAVAADRAALAGRALAVTSFVSAVLVEGPASRLVFASKTASPGVVVMSETVIDPSRVVASTPNASFHELRGIVYASRQADPSRIVLKTAAGTVLTGSSVSRLFPVGADQWLVVVGARQPLVGFFAREVPWIILGIGLVAALLATLLVEVLARRRRFAMSLVDERTATLREREATLGAVFAASPDVIAIVDPAGRLIEVSSAVERIFGYPAEYFSDRLMADLVAPEDRAVVAGAMSRLLSGGADELSIEYRIRRHDGAVSTLESQLATLRDPVGAPVGAVAVTRDITERTALERSQQEARLAAENANRSKSEFLSRMSHELRTPLNAVLGFAQLLELDDLSLDQRDAVSQILRGGRHLLDLINEVLDISRIETGALALSSEPVRLADLIPEALELVGPLAAEKDVQLRIDGGANVRAYVQADRQRLKQVLLNLLSNAVKYNRQGGRVTILVTSAEDSRLRIGVSDTGPGIPEEKRDRLFTPFDRLGAEQTDIEGTGIGLALSLRLTEAMGGRLDLDSIGGVGSTFWVELPTVESPLERYERENNALGVDAIDDHERTGRRTIVYIEDNLANLKLVERIIEQRPAVRLIPAMQGQIGLDLVRQHQPDLVLLDLHLPDLNGDKILKLLQDDAATAEIPVVILSADATQHQIDRLQEAGATAYLTKPLDVRELLNLIDHLWDDARDHDGTGRVPARPTEEEHEPVALVDPR